MDPPTSTQAGSTTQKTHQVDDESSSHSEFYDEGFEPAQPAAVTSPCMLLPIELLIDIFRYLRSSDVARSALVNRTWHAASTDPRVWRSLSFSRGPHALVPPMRALQLRELFMSTSFGTRSSHTVQAIDFGHLPPAAAKHLIEDVEASAHSLRHIFWSSSPGDLQTTCAVVALAKLCPQLETLELHVRGMYQVLVSELQEELLEDTASLARPRFFSLTVLVQSGTVLTHGMAAGLLSRATTLEFKGTKEAWRVYCSPTMSTSALHQLFQQNPAIEKLTVHGLGETRGASFSISAPSLTFLDLLTSASTQRSMTIDAPELRELAIEGHLLSSLSAASTAKLSSLTLRIAGPSVVLFGEEEPDVQDELAAIDRIIGYQSNIELIVGWRQAEQVLELLSGRFFWPGLRHVQIQVSNAQVASLVSVMAGRCIGARGASEEQYVETIRKGKAQLGYIGTEQLSVADAQATMATACAFPQRIALCSQVHWNIIESHSQDSCIIDVETLEWLEQQPNVTLERMFKGPRDSFTGRGFIEIPQR